MQRENAGPTGALLCCAPADFVCYTGFEYCDKEQIMNAREAIRILMLSPIYFKLPPNNRIKLIKEYCLMFDADAKKKKE